jgi:hypothetical protein
LEISSQKFDFCLAKTGVVSYDSFMKTTILSTNCVQRSLVRSALLFMPFLIGCFVLLPEAQAVVPAPDGGYPNFTTAEGQNALLHLTTGTANTAIGWLSLRGLTTGSFNTGVGAGTLALNNADENTATGAGALLFNTSGTGNTGQWSVRALFEHGRHRQHSYGSRCARGEHDGNGQHG